MGFPNSAVAGGATTVKFPDWTRHAPFLFFMVALFAQFPNFKFSSIQIAEALSILLVADRSLEWSRYGWRGESSSTTRAVLNYTVLVSVVLIVVTIMANATDRFSQPALLTGVFEQPYVLSLSKVIEFLLVIFVYVYAVHVFCRGIGDLRVFLELYVVFGTLAAVYGIAAVILWFALHLDIGGATVSAGSARLTGPYLEGGPFGSFLVTVILATVVLRTHFRRITLGVMWLILGTLFSALLLSRSKAAFVAIVIILAVSGFVGVTRVGRSALWAVLAVVFALLLGRSYVGQQIRGYILDASKLEEYASNLNVGGTHLDPSLFYGRVTGSIIVPRMIAHRPLVGIGLGNYPLTRNVEPYRGHLPLAVYWDDPGLGLIGYMAEVGVPAWILVFVLCCTPAIISHRRRPTQWTKMMAVAPVALFLCGTQITFMYPWIIGAAAIGLSEAEEKRAQFVASDRAASRM